MYTISVHLFVILNIFTSSMALKLTPNVCLLVEEKLNMLDLVGSWMTVYTQPRSVSCFILHIRATTDMERDLALSKYGDFKGQVNWNKCLLEVESPLGKHYLQDTNNQTELLDNIIITETEKGKYELHNQNADRWTMFGQRGSELLLMRDCGGEVVAIFARVPYWPAVNDLYALLHRSGIAPLVVDKVICSPLDKKGQRLLNHYFSKNVYKGKYELHNQNADRWTMFGQRGSELLLMRDCGGEVVAIFARVPYWPAVNDLYALLHRSGIAPLVVDKVICSPLDKKGQRLLNHYFSKNVYKG